jgi:hypothetical protein
LTTQLNAETVSVVSEQFEADDYAVYEYFDSMGWGDGLPIVAPTRSRVDKMLEGVDLPRDTVIAQLEPLRGVATVEMIAINAVMAGCLPEHLPVLVRAVESSAKPRFSLLGLNTTTNPGVPMLIINGPIRERLKLNSSWGALGPCFRANAVIGRAMGLCMINIAGRFPGKASRGTYKYPGAFTACAAENEESSPWAPMHVDLGFKAEDDVVTLLAVAGAGDLVDPNSKDPEELAVCLANMMSVQLGSNWLRPELGEMGLMLCPPHAQNLSRAFPKRSDFQEFLNDYVRVPHQLISKLRAENMEVRSVYDSSDKRGVRLTVRPDQWMIFVGGGEGGLHSCHFHTFGAAFAIPAKI